MTKRNMRSGFTLVELAIVLVIIGLIIGGVLVGQDLIKAATVRAAVSDIEKFNAAATTFRGKYNGLPGDLAAARAVEFALSGSGDTNATGAAGLRDGNGILEGGAGGSVALGGELYLFWKDLGATGLIGGTYPGEPTNVPYPQAAVTLANVNTYMPRTKLRDSASIMAYSQIGRNFYYIGAITAAITTGTVTTAGAITAIEAKSIDEKVDDGNPRTGIALSYTNLTTMTAVPGANANTNCITTTSLYNVTTAATGAPDNTVCQLQIRTAF
jgi:prepilin-type N-terminal cleavage/methylation domain-containing protein